MATAILTVVLTFALTGLLGNWLLQQWQQRNWLNQQRFLGEQKEYENLKELCEEIVAHSGRRITKMRRLLAILANVDEKLIRRRLKAYDQELLEWNEKLGGFYVRLTFYAAYEMAGRLEREVQNEFVATGRALEGLTKSRLDGKIPTIRQIGQVETAFNIAGAAIKNYNRDLLRVLEIQKTKTYYGKKIELTEESLKHFPTWELFKGLFKPWIPKLSVVRPPTDLRPPLGGGD